MRLLGLPDRTQTLVASAASSTRKALDDVLNMRLASAVFFEAALQRTLVQSPSARAVMAGYFVIS